MLTEIQNKFTFSGVQVATFREHPWAEERSPRKEGTQSKGWSQAAAAC